jgi:hypothetical protein
VCEKCNKKKKLQAQTEDYSKPLDVDWLCWWCHGEADANRHQQARNE